MECNFPFEIQFLNTHNHNRDTQKALGDLRINNRTKQIFTDYFNTGFTGGQARRMNETKLLATGGIASLANSQLNPRRATVYYLWRKFNESSCGTVVGDGLINAVIKYSVSAECDGEIKVKKLNNSGNKYIVVYVSNMMKRAHVMISWAKDIVFIDSTSSLDQSNCSLTMVMCESQIGAIPLGCIIQSNQDEISYFEG